MESNRTDDKLAAFLQRKILIDLLKLLKLLKLLWVGSVKRFVKAHELYHFQDAKPHGWFIREFRASFFPGLKDPGGLLATIIASLSKERVVLDMNIFLNKHKV